MSDQFGGYPQQGQQPGYAPAQGGYGQPGSYQPQPAYGQQQGGWGEQPAQHGGASGGQLAAFVQQYAPDQGTEVPGEEFLRYAEGKAPAALVELWRTYGIGFYGEQRLAVVDPGEWIDVLQTWLGEDVTSFPIAVTSFGHVYHYDNQGGRERIQCLDPHFQTNTVVGDDLVAFFNQHLPSPQSHVSDLEGPRGGARAKLGPLAEGELYYFEPILALGGTVSPDTLAKGDGPTHLKLIHERVLAA